MNRRDEMEQALIELISKQIVGKHALGDEGLAADDDLLGGGLVDSLGVMRLIRLLEEKYGVAVPPADVTIEHFMTVSTIASYVESLIERAAAE